MGIKKTIIVLTMVALSWAESMADGVKFLVVNGKDGTKTTFALAENPRVSCKDGNLNVVAGSRTFTLSLADVQNYQFAVEPTGIEEVLKDGGVKLENGCVVFSGQRAESIVSVYLQDGKLIKDFKADASGMVVVEMSVMPKGVLIIHGNKTNIKIINR